ncbi:protein-L-isoaspartate(D-aspartate) O-methyltransferase [Alkalitalea saponilacus]|uniref:Protein-L-isoaspartate O-methyltransferase n=1 Tax=Alkalitalea saponilacus TaxID=889453 RepID=A0A1T5HCF6_9BACT|nr:protein-L-isoaspartate(D-aspartate) O-methyltransferase [Alkalitalea saponilacus]SKC18269.1 protein-L-isoaspartate(D-aspartate) O-methyltransferase [Alkalitalea saponilacus]
MTKWFIKIQSDTKKHPLLRPLAVTVPLVFIVIIALLFINNNNTMAQDWEALRERMVNEQLKSRDIRSKSVLEAMRQVPRHLFVPEHLQRFAYEDRPLPIGLEQTISQPYIVAFMTEQINPKPGMRVLEIGTGSGYQAAVLAELDCEVYTIELLPELAERAKRDLNKANYTNVNVKTGNGYLGWPEHAPFDAIVVTAAPEEIPPRLVEQLKDGGVMILPVGPVHSLQHLKIVTKKGDEISTRRLMPVRFVPMIDRD